MLGGAKDEQKAREVYLCGCCHSMCRTAIGIAAALDAQTIDPWRGFLPAKLIHVLLACLLSCLLAKSGPNYDAAHGRHIAWNVGG